jgi:hypothetical protein
MFDEKEIKSIEDALLVPMRRGHGRIGSIFSSYGAIDRAGKRLPKWPLLNSLDTSFALNLRRVAPSDVEESLPEAVFGGLYYNWFGHFLTETVPNLIAAKAALGKSTNTPIIFFVPDNRRPEEIFPQISSVAKYFFEKIGLDPTNFRFVKQPIRIERLIVGPTPFKKKHNFSPWVLSEIDQLFGSKSSQSRRDLYLSRSQWGKARTSDETILERHFKARGFDVVHLETLSLPEQIATIRGARHVAGCNGTALHWSLYSSSCESVISLGYRSPLQRGISKSRGQVYVNPPGRRVAGESVRVRDYSAHSLDRALERVGVN